MTDDLLEPAGLRWTGHPLIDAGVAALIAFADADAPEAVTQGDLEKFANFAEQHYLKGDLSKTVDVLFTRNSFLNPSFKEERKRERIREAIITFRNPGSQSLPACTYCGQSSLRVLHRDDVPMLLGRGDVNFYPGGEPGLPICGTCQAALHGLTLGAPRCSGKALVVYTDDRRLMLRLAKKWVADTVRFAQLADLEQDVPKVSAPRTRLIEALLAVQSGVLDDEVVNGLVAYHLSNSGQGPGIDVYQLPSSIIRFLIQARAARTANVWREIERRAWQPVKGGRSAAEVSDDERLQYQNYLYEDIFRLPEDAGRFIRIYFLRNAAGLVRSGDSRTGYNSAREADIVSWDLTALFLQEVLSMEQTRIDAIRELGDRLAEHIVADNDRRMFQNAYRARDYWIVRRLLLSANLRQLNRNQPPVVRLDDYLNIFEEGEELARIDWRLAWDLVLIRLIEQLYDKGWLTQQRDLLDEAESEDEEASA